MTTTLLRPNSSLPPVEAGASGFSEVVGFTVLRGADPYWYYRVTSQAGNVTPLDDFGHLGVGFCFEKALANPVLHKVTTYKVAANEPARFVFEKRSPAPNNPPSPATIPPGTVWPVTWYNFRAIPGVPPDMNVAGVNFSYSLNPASWTDLEIVLTAMNDAGHYQVVVEGEPATGRPRLNVHRII